MNQAKENPHLLQINPDTHLDYSEMYRTQEKIQLNKRLRKTRNVLLISAAALLVGAVLFWSMPDSSFTTKDLLINIGLAAVMLILSAYSNKHPYFSVLAALLICLGLWGMEVFINNAQDMIIEISIQKLFIISLLVSCFHASKEAELIRKELHFS
jgi:hypothetical protein